MDETLVYAGVAMMPLIVGLIQFLKRFAPNAPGNLWLALSMGLGIVGQVAVQFADSGAPVNFGEVLALVLLGLAFGLATSKAYDEGTS